MTQASILDAAVSAWRRQMPFIVAGRLVVPPGTQAYRVPSPTFTINDVPVGVSYITPAVYSKLFQLPPGSSGFSVNILVLPALGENIVID